MSFFRYDPNSFRENKYLSKDFVEQIKRSYRQKLNWVRRGVFYRIGIERYYNAYKDIIGQSMIGFSLRDSVEVQSVFNEHIASLSDTSKDRFFLLDSDIFRDKVLPEAVYLAEFILADRDNLFSSLYNRLLYYEVVMMKNDMFLCFSKGLKDVFRR